MYLLDTNVISELRKQEKTHTGVQQFFSNATDQNARLYLSVITIGELRRGVDLTGLGTSSSAPSSKCH